MNERGIGGVKLEPFSYCVDGRPASGAAGGKPAGEELFAAVQDKLRPRAGRHLEGMLAGLTGLRPEVRWHAPADMLGRALEIACPLARWREDRNGEAPAPECAGCLPRYWEGAGHLSGRCRCFTGCCGVANCRGGLWFGGRRLVTVVVQARLAGAEAVVVRGPLPVVSRHRFRRSAELLQLILDDLAAAAARLAACRGRRGLPRGGDAAGWRRVGRRAAGPAHVGAIVTAMLDYAAWNYQRPIGLPEAAAALGMNASYLSDLFSRAVGVTFHRHLEDLRLARAKELLGDPWRRVGEVALAAGFSSADHFRHSFKLRTGMCPSEWR